MKAGTAAQKPTKRVYDGSGRQRDAERRRRRMVEAATELFREQGYGATSIEQIAAQAEVAPQTVQAAFGSKPGVLRRVVDVAVGGDDQDVKVRDRPQAVRIASEPDPLQKVMAAAEWAHEVHQRSAWVLRLVASVAGTDPALAALDEDLRRQWRADAQRYVDGLGAGSIRPGLTRARAGDLLTLYGGASTWATLVVDQRWTTTQYKQWLVDVIARTILKDDPRGED